MSLLFAAVVLFALLRLLPGDPANALVGVGATPDQIAAARAQVGSDLPLAAQFVSFVGSLARFDLGNSFVSKASVGGEILDRLTVTVPLTLFAFVLAILLAVPFGIIAATRADRWYGAAISVVSQLGIAIPVFWVGILLVTVFAINLKLFPSGGFPRRGWEDPLNVMRDLALPVLTVAIVMASSLLRYVRSATQDVLGSDYLRTARALGSGFGEALVRHGIRNGSVPIISILGIELASTLLLGISQRDYPNVQGVLFVSTLLVLLIGFVADIIQRLVDPRLRDRSTGTAS